MLFKLRVICRMELTTQVKEASLATGGILAYVVANWCAVAQDMHGCSGLIEEVTRKLPTDIFTISLTQALVLTMSKVKGVS